MQRENGLFSRTDLEGEDHLSHLVPTATPTYTTITRQGVTGTAAGHAPNRLEPSLSQQCPASPPPKRKQFELRDYYAMCRRNNRPRAESPARERPPQSPKPIPEDAITRFRCFRQRSPSPSPVFAHANQFAALEDGLDEDDVPSAQIVKRMRREYSHIDNNLGPLPPGEFLESSDEDEGTQEQLSNPYLIRKACQEPTRTPGVALYESEEQSVEDLRQAARNDSERHHALEMDR